MDLKRIKAIDNRFEEINEKKESFEYRICEDLSEFILQYLPIEDKLKLRCVSKQFNRCLSSLIRKQQVLRVDLKLDMSGRIPYEISAPELSRLLSESLRLWNKQITKALKTFENIKDISLDTFPPTVTPTKELLKTIINNSKQLKSIQIHFKDIDSEIINEFGHKFGKNLENISNTGFYIDQKLVLSLVGMSPNLKSIDFRVDSKLWSNSEISTKKLRKIKTLKVSNFSKKTTIDSFVEKCPELSDLTVYFDIKVESMDYMVSKLSELKKLKALDISFYKFSKELDSSLKSIALNCNQLKSFAINFSYDKPLKISSFYRHFQHFSALNKLSIRFNSNILSNINFGFLETFKYLKCLEISVNRINDNSFRGIDEFLPNVQYLTIGSNRELSDQSLYSIAKMKNLCKLKIYENFNRIHYNPLGPITDSGIISLLKDCIHLNTIKIDVPIKITEKTFKAIIEKSITEQNIYTSFEYELVSTRSLDLNKMFLQNTYPMNNIKINGITKNGLIEEKHKQRLELGIGRPPTPVHKCKFY